MATKLIQTEMTKGEAVQIIEQAMANYFLQARGMTEEQKTMKLEEIAASIDAALKFSN